MNDLILEQVTKGFGDHVVLQEFSARFPGGQCTCIMGPSGCGKTTLLRLILGLEQPDSGRILGQTFPMAAVFQENRLFEDFSALSNVTAVCSKERRSEAAQHLIALGLGESLHAPVRTLSGGMKRRVAVARAVLAPGEILILDEPFTGLDRELYNLQLSGLEYVYNGPHPEVQNPLFILNVAATDEATSASRQSWNWEVAANAPRSQVRSLDLSGKASTLTLTAYPYNGEYRQYPISYTLQTIYANVPRAFDFSLVRWAAVLALLSAVYALRPVSAAWRDAYLTHRKKYRPVVLLVAVILGAAAFFAPFADRFNAGVSTSFYNTADWDGGSRINFTLHIDDWASDAAAQYGALAHSLLNGRLDLEQNPPAAMQEMANPYDTAARQQAASDALWDVAYYQGRYYVYFGVIPCLLFQLPFEALTGVRDLPPSLPMILLSWLFLLAAPLLVKQARYVMREMDPVAMRPMLERTVKGALLTNLLFVLGIFLSQWAA